MKICIVSLNIVPYYHRENGTQYGGAEVQAAVLARAFSEAGAEVELVVADLPEGRELPVPAQNAFDAAGGIPGLRFFHPRMSGINAALRRADADVYFQHCAGMITGLTAHFCRKHGKVFVYFAGSDADFSPRRANAGNARDRFLFFYGLRAASGIVAQNEFQARACRERLGREAVVIPTAVTPVEHDATVERDAVVWVGALREAKRPDRFIELARRMPEHRFIMIGGELASAADYGRAILREAESVDNLTATGRVAPEAVGGYLDRARVLVNTSEYEGFPNAFLEAWQREVPAVSLVDVDGMIAGEGLGAVCSDLDDMTRVLGKLLGDEDALRAAGRRARELVARRFSADVLAQQYLRYFRELIEKQHAH